MKKDLWRNIEHANNFYQFPIFESLRDLHIHPISLRFSPQRLRILKFYMGVIEGAYSRGGWSLKKLYFALGLMRKGTLFCMVLFYLKYAMCNEQQ